MVEGMIHNPYQDTLAERSLVIEPAEEGEYWTFHWYVDPLSYGLSKWHRFFAHVDPDGKVDMIGMWVATSEEESLAQEQAIAFAKARYERYGLDEQNQESGN